MSPRAASLKLVDRELRAALGAIPDVDVARQGVVAARALGNSFRLDYLGEVANPIERSEILVEASTGHKIRTILHRPIDAAQDAPVLLQVHGGGMVMGVPDMLDRRNEVLASRYGCIIASPDYRKAPEHTGPAGAQDCYDVLAWLADGGASADRTKPRKIVAAGESGGGGIVAGCALMDRATRNLDALILFSPMLDDRTSIETTATGPYGDFGWSASTNQFCWDAVVGEANRDTVSEFASPARAEDLSAMPPTFISVGQLDLFFKESVEFGVRLSDANVPVELHVYAGAPHGFPCVLSARVAQRAWRDFECFLERALAGDL